MIQNDSIDIIRVNRDTVDTVVDRRGSEKGQPLKNNPLLKLDSDKVGWWRYDREELEITVGYGEGLSSSNSDPWRNLKTLTMNTGAFPRSRRTCRKKNQVPTRLFRDPVRQIS